MRLTLETPADRLLTERSQTISGWVDDPGTPFALAARAGARAIPLRPFIHPATYDGTALRGFWGYLTLQELLPEVRDGHLTLDFCWDGCPLASVHLRVSPLAETLARGYPLNLATYPVPAAKGGAAPPVTIVFPGLGGVGGSSLNDLLRRRMFRAGWDLPLYHEADDPVLWARIAARGRAPRWIDGHDCRDAARRLAGPSARVTLLREPLARALSVFSYNTLVHPDRFPVTRFEDFVLAGGARAASQARALLRLAGHGVADALPEGELYRLARDELDTAYALVGITELFEESVFLLCRLAGYEDVGMWRRVLSAPRCVRLDALAPAVRRALERQLAADLELYDECRAALARRARAAGFGAALAAYKRDAAAAPELPEAYKAVECLRWRQTLVESELARLRAARAHAACGGRAA